VPHSPPSDSPSISFVFFVVGEGEGVILQGACLPLLCDKREEKEGEEKEKGEEEGGKEEKTFMGLFFSFCSSIMCAYMWYMSQREGGKKRRCVCRWGGSCYFYSCMGACLGGQQQQQ
jgi:hypothetical protein